MFASAFVSSIIFFLSRLFRGDAVGPARIARPRTSTPLSIVHQSFRHGMVVKLSQWSIMRSGAPDPICQIVLQMRGGFFCCFASSSSSKSSSSASPVSGGVSTGCGGISSRKKEEERPQNKA